jgi:hypothetical protein
VKADRRSRLHALLCACAGFGGACLDASAAQPAPATLATAQPAPAARVANPAPKTADWLAIAKLPDWSGAWVPDIRDQTQQETSNPPPWNVTVAKQMEQAYAEQNAGRPRGLFAKCLPEGSPSGMLVNHIGMEILFSPGRVTILGDGDGNKLQRIYTDGRGHDPDPLLTLYGDSIGHWEGGTLVVDTTGLLPQVMLAVNEAVGVPSDGDMHVVERIHLHGPDTLDVDLTITAPKIFTRPWQTTRIYRRDRRRVSEIKEAICVQGTNFTAGEDQDGHAVWVPQAYDSDSGTPVPAQPH